MGIMGSARHSRIHRSSFHPSFETRHRENHSGLLQGLRKKSPLSFEKIATWKVTAVF